MTIQPDDSLDLQRTTQATKNRLRKNYFFVPRRKGKLFDLAQICSLMRYTWP